MSVIARSNTLFCQIPCCVGVPFCEYGWVCVCVAIIKFCASHADLATCMLSHMVLERMHACKM